MSYDAWKTRSDPHAPGRGNGVRRTYVLICAGCEFSGEFAAAVDHYLATGHELLGRHGHPQDLRNAAHRREQEKATQCR